jgi:hypothetical protein
LRASNIPAQPAKHTRQTYIHEAFPSLLYQTRKGVICFAPFQHPDSTVSTLQSLPTQSVTRHRTAALGRHTPSQYFDSKDDKSSPEQGREAAAKSPTRVPSAASLISFDRDVPAKSSRSGDILSVITRILPAKNSRNRFSVDFRRRATAVYFWGGTSATRWE